jgi:hypothetical protein
MTTTTFNYLIAFVTPEGNHGGCDITRPVAITSNQHVREIEDLLRDHMRSAVTVIAFSLYANQGQADR